jgi:hypothetical protein
MNAIAIHSLHEVMMARSKAELGDDSFSKFKAQLAQTGGEVNAFSIQSKEVRLTQRVGRV